MSEEYLHSVTLDKDLCKGCTNCISHCPTEAIRVRDGKAMIISNRCIDCGQCIRTCPSHAKKAVSDPLDMLNKYTFKVALPAPSFYAQFKNVPIDTVLTALKKIGFDDVYEVASAAEIASIATAELLEKVKSPRPMISSSCPAVVRLIQVRFPSLIEHVIKIQTPMEIAARIVKNQIYPDKRGLGVFFISPCPAKVTSVRVPLGNEKSEVDGVIAQKDIYPALRKIIKTIDKPEHLSKASSLGIRWGHSDGESEAVNSKKSISVDGIDHVIRVLEQIESEDFHHIEFIEAMACPGGCVGGTLTVENPFIARSRLKRYSMACENRGIKDSDQLTEFDISWTKEIYSHPVLKLSENMSEAIKMMDEIEKIDAELPGLDCGSCGAPTCHSLAEDIVTGKAQKTDCIFILRDEIKKVAGQMAELERRMPQTRNFDKR
ncbi:MAG: 4Fe-4S binding protein [Spirochaetia bacterium]|nr:4Fe-4S binding protein [Spirochaetia bacterium]MBO7516229.1 4Fe-4S binding protein [Spirochaetia bacterium]